MSIRDAFDAQWLAAYAAGSPLQEKLRSLATPKQVQAALDYAWEQNEDWFFHFHDTIGGDAYAYLSEVLGIKEEDVHV